MSGTLRSIPVSAFIFRRRFFESPLRRRHRAVSDRIPHAEAVFKGARHFIDIDRRRWQDCCLVPGMNDSAYDISHLLASAGPPAKPRIEPVAKAPAPPPAPVIVSVAAAQEAMARELIQAATAHEEMIRQYVTIAGSLKSGEPFA